MSTLSLDAANAIYYQHTPASRDDSVTFVFFNALTGDAGMWLGEIAPALHEQGHGTLVWNFRGQADSPVSPDLALDDHLIVADVKRLLAEVQPAKPVLVGLSIGGLFAARAWLQDCPAVALVLINTLRRPSPRLAWVNDATLRCAAVGGLELVRDLFGGLIFNEDWLAENRANAFPDQPYTPLAPDSGHYRLLSDCRRADWDLPYEKLDLPVLVLSGLQDDMFFNAADVDAYAARLPNAQRINFADSGHMVPIERPAGFIKALQEFAQAIG